MWMLFGYWVPAMLFFGFQFPMWSPGGKKNFFPHKIHDLVYPIQKTEWKTSTRSLSCVSVKKGNVKFTRLIYFSWSTKKTFKYLEMVMRCLNYKPKPHSRCQLFYYIWKKLFGVLREMPGLKDQNIDVFAKCARHVAVTRHNFRIFWLLWCIFQSFYDFSRFKCWKVCVWCVVCVCSLQNQANCVGFCSTPKTNFQRVVHWHENNNIFYHCCFRAMMQTT